MKELQLRRARLVLAFVAAGILAASGATAIVSAVAPQQQPPQPAPSAAGFLEPRDRPALIPAVVPSANEISEVVGPVLPVSEPTRIDIPGIGVHSGLLYLGLTPEQTLEVPAGPYYDDAAWYEYSSTPGSIGPAVILGHVDSKSGPSVFFNLGKLIPGDEILVTREDGLVAVFRVDGVRSFPKDQFPTALVYDSTDHAALRLITCGGAFDDASGEYLDNIVVFASLIGSR